MTCCIENEPLVLDINQHNENRAHEIRIIIGNNVISRNEKTCKVFEGKADGEVFEAQGLEGHIENIEENIYFVADDDYDKNSKKRGQDKNIFIKRIKKSKRQ